MYPFGEFLIFYLLYVYLQDENCDHRRGELVYKSSNSLFYATIDILKIDNTSQEKSFLFARVVIRYNGKERAFLYSRFPGIAGIPS